MAKEENKKNMNEKIVDEEKDCRLEIYKLIEEIERLLNEKSVDPKYIYSKIEKTQNILLHKIWNQTINTIKIAIENFISFHNENSKIYSQYEKDGKQNVTLEGQKLKQMLELSKNIIVENTEKLHEISEINGKICSIYRTWKILLLASESIIFICLVGLSLWFPTDLSCVFPSWFPPFLTPKIIISIIGVFIAFLIDKLLSSRKNKLMHCGLKKTFIKTNIKNKIEKYYRNFSEEEISKRLNIKYLEIEEDRLKKLIERTKEKKNVFTEFPELTEEANQKITEETKQFCEFFIPNVKEYIREQKESAKLILLKQQIEPSEENIIDYGLNLLKEKKEKETEEAKKRIEEAERNDEKLNEKFKQYLDKKIEYYELQLKECQEKLNQLKQNEKLD